MTDKILSLIPTMQGITLLSENIPKKKKNLLKQGVRNIVGLSLIQSTAKFI